MTGMKTFKEFWPYYLNEHKNPLTKRYHFYGTSLAIGCLVTGVLLKAYELLPFALALGYFPAWFSHFRIEKNRPATWKYPLWSLRADLKMWLMILNGKLSISTKK